MASMTGLSLGVATLVLCGRLLAADLPAVGTSFDDVKFALGTPTSSCVSRSTGNGVYGFGDVQVLVEDGVVVSARRSVPRIAPLAVPPSPSAWTSSTPTRVVGSSVAVSQPLSAVAASPVIPWGLGYGEISDVTGQPRTQYVHGYTRADGTQVRPYYRSHR